MLCGVDRDARPGEWDTSESGTHHTEGGQNATTNRSQLYRSQMAPPKNPNLGPYKDMISTLAESVTQVEDIIAEGHKA